MTKIYEYLGSNPLVSYIFMAVIIILLVLLLVKIAQREGLEKIRKAVYIGFVEAENLFLQGENQEKFDYVVNIAKETIPKPFNIFITDKLLKDTIQIWFNLCKDLLDDGKLNKSVEMSEEQEVSENE